jgi:hypothetical protein
MRIVPKGMDYTGSARLPPGGERIGISAPGHRFERVLVKTQMIFNEGAYKKITVIIAWTHGDRCRIIRRLTGGNEVFDLQLLSQEFIRISLVHQQGQMP